VRPAYRRTGVAHALDPERAERDIRRRPARRRTGTRAVYLKDVCLHLVSRQLSARYRRSLLGWLWALAPPFAQLAVFYFVFTQVIPTTIDDYVAFLFIGIVTWGWFATGLTLAATSVESRRDLVTRPGFPTALLPLVAVAVAFVDYMLTLPVLLVVVALSTGLHATAMLLPVLLAIQFVLIVGIGWVVAPVNVFFRDVGHLVGVVVLLGFFLTPVFYSREQAPDSYDPFYDLNPMAQLLDAHRAVLLDGSLPGLGTLVLVALAAVVAFGVGLGVFMSVRESLPEQV
jgi:lipopolysaccharide transport system permease protein